MPLPCMHAAEITITEKLLAGCNCRRLTFGAQGSILQGLLPQLGVQVGGARACTCRPPERVAQGQIVQGAQQRLTRLRRRVWGVGS